jgi:hypothetical protein
MSAVAQASPSVLAAQRIGARPRFVPLHPVAFIHRDERVAPVDVPPPIGVAVSSQPAAARPAPQVATPAAWQAGSPAALQFSPSPRVKAPPATRSTAWAVISGIVLLLADSVPEVFRPIAFFFQNRLILVEAVIYASMPLVFSIALYLTVPGLIASFPLSTLGGWAFVAALFCACAVLSCVVLAGLRGLAQAAVFLGTAARRRSAA